MISVLLAFQKDDLEIKDAQLMHQFYGLYLNINRYSVYKAFLYMILHALLQKSQKKSSLKDQI